MTSKPKYQPKKGDRFIYTGGYDLEIMTSPPLHVAPDPDGGEVIVTAASASQAEHMWYSKDFGPAPKPAPKPKAGG